jgi:hypothetical protein
MPCEVGHGTAVCSGVSASSVSAVFAPGTLSAVLLIRDTGCGIVVTGISLAFGADRRVRTDAVRRRRKDRVVAFNGVSSEGHGGSGRRWHSAPDHDRT